MHVDPSAFKCGDIFFIAVKCRNLAQLKRMGGTCAAGAFPFDQGRCARNLSTIQPFPERAHEMIRTLRQSPCTIRAHTFINRRLNCPILTRLG